MTELSQTLTTDYRTAQGDYQRIQYIPVSQAGGGLSQPQHIQLQVVQVAPVRIQTQFKKCMQADGLSSILPHSVQKQACVCASEKKKG